MNTAATGLSLRRLCFLFATVTLADRGQKMPILDGVGCVKGSLYTPQKEYAAVSSQWGLVPRGGWRGAVLGPKGDKIYGIPTNATSVLEIDPITRTISTFGNLGSSLSDTDCSGHIHCGDEKWIGGILVPATGKIIGIPYAAETVLEIDPVARTTSTFGIVSSSVKRKWVDGVLGRNGLIYAIPYDADVVLEINPDTRALMLFGRVGGDPCKWYGGVLAPNGKIYAIPYSSPYVLEIDTERRIARPFAMTFPHWGKWSGGVLAPNGKIYGMPALAKSVLEIDVEREQTSLYGMLPGGSDLQDKWSGGVLAPNGKIYGVPWRSSKVLEFDPTTKAISLIGSNLGASNFSWGGAALSKSGKIVAVPYNGAWILEIGENVCSQPAGAPIPVAKGMLPPIELPGDLTSTASLSRTLTPPPPLVLKQVGSVTTPSDRQQAAMYPTTNAPMANAPTALYTATAAKDREPGLAQYSAGSLNTIPSTSVVLGASSGLKTFVLALLGCPNENKASEDACFNLQHRTWHSAMVTIMKAGSSLLEIREQVAQSRLSHVPTNFCFLYNGHALDPNVENTIKAGNVAVATAPTDGTTSQSIILIDNINCNIGDRFSIASSAAAAIGVSQVALALLLIMLIAVSVLVVARCLEKAKSTPRHEYYSPEGALAAQEAQSLMDNDAKPCEKKGLYGSISSTVPCPQLPRFRPLINKNVTRAQQVARTFKSEP